MNNDFIFLGIAPKLNRRGFISYRVSLDDAGNQYVQFVRNDKKGTFSDIIYSVKKYAPLRHSSSSIGFPQGYSLACTGLVESKNTNDGGFLKAVLRHHLHLTTTS